jgi:acetaldehyde dehydrogenase (acetylating)
MKFALEKPAFRIVVNSPSSLGAVGFTTALMPSLTLGVGTWAGSSISENVSAKHLINIKTLAFETNPLTPGHSLNSFSDKTKSKVQTTSFTSSIEERLLARAGNPKVNPFISNSTNKKVEKTSYNLGKGISESDVQKIINEFKKK